MGRCENLTQKLVVSNIANILYVKITRTKELNLYLPLHRCVVHSIRFNLFIKKKFTGLLIPHAAWFPSAQVFPLLYKTSQTIALFIRVCKHVNIYRSVSSHFNVIIS